MKRIDCDHKNKTILLFPDFSSTGMWCECGIAFGDPEEEFPHIPAGLISLIGIWNYYWDATCSSKWKHEDEKLINYIQEDINEAGKELEKILMTYHPCKFIEENAKIIKPSFLSEINKQMFPEEF